MAVSGDTAVIGAYKDDDGGSGSGSAYAFVRTGTSWSQQAKLTASDAAANDKFGYSVAVVGDTAVIGKRYYDDYGGSTDSGSTDSAMPTPLRNTVSTTPRPASRI